MTRFAAEYGSKPSVPTDTRVEFELLDERRFSNGVVHLRYRPLYGEPVPHSESDHVIGKVGSPMRVIGAGFGRTGTLSFKRALEDLGFGPTYHMQEVMRRPSHIDRWLRYARTGEVNWDELFSGFGSGVDYPVSCVWEELASHFPDAKVVLTVRDPQQWWASTASTIYRFRTAFPAWMLRSVPVTRHFVEMVDRLVWDGLFDGRFTDRDHAVAIFERHIEDVRATCPPERLLVFDVADGWEPLCTFLNAPVPRHPFPHLNDAKVTRRVVAAMRWGTRAMPVVVASGAAGLVVRRRRPRDI